MLCNRPANSPLSLRRLRKPPIGGESEKGKRLTPSRAPVVMIREREVGPKRLHNFNLPQLRWGNQKRMRCLKLSNHSSSSSSSSSISAVHRRSAQPSVIRTRFAGAKEDGDGINAVREKLMLDLRTETDKIKEKLLKGDKDEEEDEERAEQKLARVVAAMAGRREEYEAAETRPWNLRTRRAACKAPAAKNGSPARKEGVAEEEKASPEKEKEREKFAVALKRKEIEEDFWKLTGHRPPRRPKKRQRTVQKQLDMLFPGLWLTEITSDAYKVIEVPDNGKR